MAVGSISIIGTPAPLPPLAGLQEDMAVLGIQKDMICTARVHDPGLGPLAALDQFRLGTDQYPPQEKIKAPDVASAAVLAIAAMVITVTAREVAVRAEVGVKVEFN